MTHYRTAPTNGSVCYGDSGGPLVETRQAQDGTRDTTMIGVLASFFTTSPDETCVPGTEAVYSSLIAKRGLLDEVRRQIQVP